QFEAINNIRTVKVMSMAKSVYNVIANANEILVKKMKVRIKWFQFRNGFLTFLATAFKVLIIFVIVLGVLKGHYEVGFLILFNGYFSDLRASIDELSRASQDFVTAKFSMARIKLILDEPIAIDDDQGKVALAEDWQKIYVKNVSFSYG